MLNFKMMSYSDIRETEQARRNWNTVREQSEQDMPGKSLNDILGNRIFLRAAFKNNNGKSTRTGRKKKNQKKGR
jgi:hypothetical protein